MVNLRDFPLTKMYEVRGWCHMMIPFRKKNSETQRKTRFALGDGDVFFWFVGMIPRPVILGSLILKQSVKHQTLKFYMTHLPSYLFEASRLGPPRRARNPKHRKKSITNHWAFDFGMVRTWIRNHLEFVLFDFFGMSDLDVFPT